MSSPREVEVALSVALADWFAKSHPDTDVETTPLSELGGDEPGIVLTVGDSEFTIMIQQTS